jgi:hypothetical protein
MAALTIIKVGVQYKTEGMHMFLIKGIIVKQCAKNTWIGVKKYQCEYFTGTDTLKMCRKWKRPSAGRILHRCTWIEIIKE